MALNEKCDCYEHPRDLFFSFSLTFPAGDVFRPHFLFTLLVFEPLDLPCLVLNNL